MGADIHMFAEKRAKKSGKWQKIGHRFKDQYYPMYKKWEEEGKKMPDFVKEFTDQPYQHRNYDLFAILADVRNGTWGERFEPIDMPRGLPIDVSNAIRKQSDGWGSDGHSHSFFTVAELLTYDWKKMNHHAAVVDEEQFVVWRNKGKPDSYSASVGGGNTQVLEWYDMERLLDGKLKREPGASYYARVEWDEPYYENVQDFIEETLPQLQAMGDPKDVRIVFWFDN